MTEYWEKLQNGSDIRGIALPGIEGEAVNLTPEAVQAISSAFGSWLAKCKNKPLHELRIAIGHDSRLSAPTLKQAAILGLTRLDCSVFDCGLASTPGMYMSTVMPEFRYDGAIMITASHLPFNRNGLKFFTDKGGLEKDEIHAILTGAAAIESLSLTSSGSLTEIDLISSYSNLLIERIRKGINHPGNYNQPLTGFKIIVDAGNGAAGFFVDKVLKPLGADTTGSQFLEPDGSFPNHIPNPEDAKAMDSICSEVMKHHADLGIIFDADGDRSSVVDQSGKEINRNRLIALMAAIILEEHPGSTIVTDSVTSTGLSQFIESRLGGTHHRFKRGYKNVINEAIRLNREGVETQLAIETSGHGALKENYFLDDGAYLVAKILIKMAKLHLEGVIIGSLIEALKEPLESREFRLKIDTEDFKSYGETVLANLKEYAAQEPSWQVEPKNYEGIRVSFDRNHGDGWFLLRLSLHDPLLPLNIESNVSEGAKTIAGALLPFLRKYPLLMIESIEKFVNP